MNEKKAFKYALARLTSRDHSCAELAAKMRKKGFSPQDIQQALSTCHRLGYLNDRRYAANLAANQKSKGYGPAKLRALLYGKGLNDKIVKFTIEENFSPGEQRKAAITALNKKLRLGKIQHQRDLRQKLWRYLRSRGFSNDIIAELLAPDMLDKLLSDNKG